jgi:hypothetical protein
MYMPVESRPISKHNNIHAKAFESFSIYLKLQKLPEKSPESLQIWQQKNLQKALKIAKSVYTVPQTQSMAKVYVEKVAP